MERVIDLDKLAEGNRAEGVGRGEVHTAEMLYAYGILASASRDDPELLTYAADVINATSLAYVAYCSYHSHCHVIATEEDYVYHCGVLYPSDLSGDELCRALRIAWLAALPDCVIPNCVIVAAHHGNADLTCKELLRARLVYLSRCDVHVLESYRDGLKAIWLKTAPWVYSSHCESLHINCRRL